MRRYESEDESAGSSGDESCNFKRSKRYRKADRATESQDQVDSSPVVVRQADANPESKSKGSSVGGSIGVSVIQYASSASSTSVGKASNSNNVGVGGSTSKAVNLGGNIDGKISPEDAGPSAHGSSSPKITRQLSMPDTITNRFSEEPSAEVQALENNNKHVTLNLGKKSLVISDKSSATEIMRKMGFDSTRGLGQLMCDREVSSSTLEKLQKILDEAGIKVDEDSLDLEEEIHVEENIDWIPPVLLEDSLKFSTISEWMKVGPKKTTIRDETNFLPPDMLKELLVLKQCFNVMSEHDYKKIRARSNPFEKTGKGPFVSRAGLKMASLDAALSHSLTQPTTNSADKQSFVSPNELLYFADVCAGPGGFSEYVLFRKRWGAKGFGMTLKGKLDFDTLSFFLGSPESFEPFYGPANDGNVYNPKNVVTFIDYVLRSTEGRGVHLMMADGGFDVKNKEMQEPMSAQIYVAQCMMALSLVRPGGMFICKLFDTLTPFTVGLIYLMYHSFDLIAIHKPNTSRPGNSERYLVCKWKAQRDRTDEIGKYLSQCHQIYWEWTCMNRPRTDDILELVPLTEIKKSEKFYKYMLKSNKRIARRQIENLKKMVIFSRDPHLKDSRQDFIVKRCFEYWKVPEKTSKSVIQSHNASTTPEKAMKKLFGTISLDFLGSEIVSLTEHNLGNFIRSPYDWRIVVIEAFPEENNRGFYFSLGNERIYRYNGKTWIHIVEKLELCKDTLIYGEFVDEIHGKKPNQSKVRTFHIIDAMILGGTDICGLHYTSRHEVCVKFARSMNKPSRPDLCAVRAKVPVRMENIADVFDRLENRVVSGCGQHSQLVCPVDHTDETLPFIKPLGILFLKITKDPWTLALSRSSNRKYYFNFKSGTATFDGVQESVSDFSHTMQNRIIWWWDKELKSVLSTQDVTDDKLPVTLSQSSLNPHTLLKYVGGAWQLNKNTMRRLNSSSSQASCGN